MPLESYGWVSTLTDERSALIQEMKDYGVTFEHRAGWGYCDACNLPACLLFLEREYGPCP